MGHSSAARETCIRTLIGHVGINSPTFGVGELRGNTHVRGNGGQCGFKKNSLKLTTQETGCNCV